MGKGKGKMILRFKKMSIKRFFKATYFSLRNLMNRTNLMLGTRNSFAILFLIGSLFFSSCTSIQPVMISGVHNFTTGNLVSNPEIKFDLGVKNPNSFGVTVKRMSVNVLLSDSVVAGINIPVKTKIGAQSTIDIPITLKPSVSSLTQMAMSGFKNLFSSKSNSNMELKGEIVIRKFIFTKKIKISEKIKL
ncbi:MAG TPA: LEA type 2 family protein [Bacteroidia bacterium]|nr:LEA type 2 family protein [Bacteroidia bacterium]